VNGPSWFASECGAGFKEPRLPFSSVSRIWELRGLALAQSREMTRSEAARCRDDRLSYTGPHFDSILQAVLLRACDQFILGSESTEVRYLDRWLRGRVPALEYKRRFEDLVSHIWRDVRDPASRDDIVSSNFLIMSIESIGLRQIGTMCSTLWPVFREQFPDEDFWTRWLRRIYYDSPKVRRMPKHRDLCFVV
jgi:hypothetical protein